MNVTRNTYFNHLQKLSDSDDRLVFVSADCAGLVFDRYRETHPKQFLSVGIAEQNMIAVACGLALSGKRPIVYGHAPFATIRALDQIRNCAALMRLSISIVVNGIGFAQPYFGATHFNTEDLGNMSLIPGIRIITPSSPLMGKAAADYTLLSQSPLYIRFDPHCDKEIYAGYPIDFAKGFEVLRSGKTVAVITCGSYTQRALALANDWKGSGIDAAVIDVYSLPFDVSCLLNLIDEMPIVVIDEQVESGSFGMKLLYELNRYGKHNLARLLGIDFNGSYPDMSSKNYSSFLEMYGFTDADITKTVLSVI